ncbi:MAG TPA: Asp-tRNA(Asn)/Glu-tRNA(Gln) amidotransferase subunit GatC [Methanocorpusculum sp.]|nr:Asp-tRNA(Asn)/Glu-tRNA(Gln) amidotransferase subunit GatC [Methanocorpusculum sp.]HJJ50791.1 Asp-tRNA(Asn)/Glu-tRNA(Gln) amidotransferase subunit GatC [Methanocorpusculum sp.]
MIKESDVLHMAELSDIGISSDELGKFTEQFNAILEYFDILDTLEASTPLERQLVNIFREDEVTPSISQEDALRNSHNPEDGYVRAPKVV